MSSEHLGPRVLPPTSAIYFGYDGLRVSAGSYADECENEWHVVRIEPSQVPDYATHIGQFDDDLEIVDFLRDGGGVQLRERGVRLKVKDKKGRILLWKDNEFSDIMFIEDLGSMLPPFDVGVGHSTMDRAFEHVRGKRCRMICEPCPTTLGAVRNLGDVFGALIDTVSALKPMHAVGYVHQDIGLHSIIYIDGVGYLSEIDTNIAFLGTPRRACSDPVWIEREKARNANEKDIPPVK